MAQTLINVIKHTLRIAFNLSAKLDPKGKTYFALINLLHALSRKSWIQQGLVQNDLIDNFEKHSGVKITNKDKFFQRRTFIELWRKGTRKLYNKVSPGLLNNIIVMENEILFRQSLEQGRGTIIVFTHSGGISPLLNFIYREADNYFSIGGFARYEKVAMRANDVKNAFRCLLKGGAVVIAGDGVQGSEYRVHPFLNKQRKFQLGFAKLAIESGAEILFGDSSPREDGRFDVKFHRPASFSSDTLSEDEKIDSLSKDFAIHLESIWKRRPENISTKELRRYVNETTIY
jgi:lauroyl/myristoyl acyltransferase